jgi:hypothetical protein
MRVVCKCYICGRNMWVDFILPPTEEDKLGFICDECANEHDK